MSVFVYRESVLGFLADASLLQYQMQNAQQYPNTRHLILQARELFASPIVETLLAAPGRVERDQKRFEVMRDNTVLSRVDIAGNAHFATGGQLIAVPLEFFLALPVFLTEVKKKPPVFESQIPKCVRLNKTTEVKVRHEYDFMALLTGASVLTAVRDPRLDTVFVNPATTPLALMLLSPGLGKANAGLDLSDTYAHVHDEPAVGFNWDNAVNQMCDEFNRLAERVQVCSAAAIC